MFPDRVSLVEIPHIFHSVELGGPFTSCQICTRRLVNEGQPYLIEKVFRGTETIIEIATCMACTIQVQGSMSKESTLTMQREFHGKINWTERLSWLDDQGPVDPNRWIDHCVITGAERCKTLNFQIGGMFFGDQLALSALPYLVSAKAVEEIGEKLSQETRGYMQDFVGDQFGMPPEFCNPQSPLPLLI